MGLLERLRQPFRGMAASNRPSDGPAQDDALLRRLADRVRALEGELAQARLDIARLQVDQAAMAGRHNAFADLTEQRIDTLYRQIILELKRAFDLGAAVVETETAMDKRLAELFSAGLHMPVDPSKLAMDTILSGQLQPGRLEGALTLYGFRINRDRARETGGCIAVSPVSAGGAGTAVYGPYKRLRPGTYAITAHLRPGKDAQAGAPTGDVALDVYSPAVGQPLAAQSIGAERLAGPSDLQVHFDWSADAAADVVEIRLHQRSSVPLKLTGFTLERT